MNDYFTYIFQGLPFATGFIIYVVRLEKKLTEISGDIKWIKTMLPNEKEKGEQNNK